MKISVDLYQIANLCIKAVPLWFFACLFLFGFSFSTSVAEQGILLGPAFPSENEREEEYRPNSISPIKEKLPLPQKLRPMHSAADHAQFGEILNRNETIIPQRFLSEESSPAVTTPETLPSIIPDIPKTLPKRKPQADFSSKMTTVAPPLVADPPLGEGEFIVDEETIKKLNLLAANETIGTTTDGISSGMIETMANGNQNSSLYNELSPLLESNYAGPMMLKPFGTGLLDNLTLSVGTTGFKSEPDAGRNGNFGFSEGVNWSGPVTPQCTVSGQAGLRVVQSNVNGTAEWNKTRNQYFVTAGLFKRDLSLPVQGGLVMDWYQDNYYNKIKSQQLRYEISARTFSNTEYGFLGGFGLTQKGNTYINTHWAIDTDEFFRIKPQQYYLLFLRKHLNSGGLVEFRVGATEHGDVVLGGFGDFPLNDRFTVNGGFTTMIPKEGHGYKGYARETWEISVGMTFYFRGGACTRPVNMCRPMFDVAGNGSFFHRIVRK